MLSDGDPIRTGTFHDPVGAAQTACDGSTAYVVMVSGSIQVACQHGMHVQSFGAKNYSVLGIILQRALLVTAAASVLIIAFWTQMGKLLILLGRSPL